MFASIGRRRLLAVVATALAGLLMLPAFTGAQSSPNSWSQLQPSGTPPTPREGHSAVWDPADDEMIVFGGTGSTGLLNDLWVYAPASNQWLQLAPSGALPSPRAGHSAVWDPVDSEMLVFGGGISGPPFLSDLWAYKPAINQWTQLTPSGQIPVARSGQSAVWDATSGRMLVFGGVAGSSLVVTVNDLWSYQPETNSWTQLYAEQLSPIGQPPGRFEHAAVWDNADNQMLVFGGEFFLRLTVAQNDLWSYQSATNTWTQIMPTGSIPSPRFALTGVWDAVDLQMFVFGGIGGVSPTPGGPSNELWTYHAGGSSWTQLSPTGPLPGARYNHSAIWDVADSQMLVFGGQPPSPATTPLNDLWAYQVTQSASAPPTFSPAGGTYLAAQTVNVRDKTPGAAIHYTTDGSTPTTVSPTFTMPFSVGSSEVINAIALAPGLLPSAVTTAAYNIVGRANWPVFRFDLPHTGFNPFETMLGSASVPGLTTLWTGATGNRITSSPTVVNGVAYVGSHDDKLYAFDASGITNCSGSPSTCAPLWTATTGNILTSSPAVANGVVYVGSEDTNLYAFDAAGVTNCSGAPTTCAPQWTASTGGLIASSPTPANGVVYVNSFDGKLYAFDGAGISNCSGTPKTCSPLWTAAAGRFVVSSPAVANGVVYVSSQDNNLYAFDATGMTNCVGVPRTCAPLWTGVAGGPISSSPAVANGMVYVSSQDHKLYAFDAAGIANCAGTPKTCSPVWVATTANNIYSSPAVANGVVYVGSQDNSLYAFDSAGVTNCSGTPKTCSPLWTATTGNNILDSSPTVANGIVYIGSTDTKVYAFDATGTANCSGTPRTCAPLWTAATGNSVISSPSVDNGVVYVGSDDGKLYAFGIPRSCVVNTLAASQPHIAPGIAPGMVTANAVADQPGRLDPAPFRRLRDEVLVHSQAGRRYVALYNTYSPEVVQLMLKDAQLRDAILQGLLVWQSDLNALLNGHAANVHITRQEVSAVKTVLDRLNQVGSPGLRESIRRETTAHPVEQFAGKSLDQGLARVIRDDAQR